LRALLAAWQKLEAAFPGQLSFKPNADFFVMHAYPPNGARRGWVEFTPTDEVLAQLRAKPPSTVRNIPVREDQYQKAYGYGVKDTLAKPDTTDSQETK
jgi:hypothetical protein